MHILMPHIDYKIQDTDDPEELAKRIFYSIFIRRVKGNKPAITLVIAPSGEGKSEGVIRIEEILMELQGVEVTPEVLEVMNVCLPTEYPEKIHSLLHDPKFKKVNVVALHEAGDLVSASNWQDFVTKAVASINNQSRKIKPLIIFIISQHLKQIAPSTRRTCTYYVEAKRSIGHHTKFHFYAIWEKKRGLEHADLMPRRLSGFVVNKKGKQRRHYLDYVEMGRPSKQNRDIFDTLDTEAKTTILAQKLGETLRKIKQEAGDYGKKINAMVEYYTESPDRIQTIGKRFRGKWKVRSEIVRAHDLSPEEARIFEQKLTDRLEESNLLAPETPEEAA